MSTEPTLRLHLFHARDTPKTVILRQGPSRTYRMILWDRDGDPFQDGQWPKTKVYIQRCDIAPDGEHFLYFTLDGQWDGPSKGSYTVISRPPYFTALRLYPQGNTWGGGGYFLDARKFYVATYDSTPDIIGAEAPLERVFRSKTTLFNLFSPKRFMDASGNRLGSEEKTDDRTVLDRPFPGAEEYVTEGHCLYRRTDNARHLIRDFSDMAFEPILAPYATSTRADWHPLDGETR